MVWVFIADTVKEYKNAAEKIVQLMEEFHVFLLSGTLGAGKTTFVQEICQLLSTEDIVTSPSFSLINPYLTDKGKVFHMDMYRINDADEAIDFGIEEYLWDEEVYCFIEWPEIINALLPDKYVTINIDQIGQQSRKIAIEQHKIS